MTDILFSYDKITQVLQHCKAQLSASEAHGILVGLHCVSSPLQNSHEERLGVVLKELDCCEGEWQCKDILKRLQVTTLEQLEGMSFSFMPLLPNENSSLSEQVDALGAWCRGFLYGLGLGGLNEADLSAPLALEALQDLNHIAYGELDSASSEDNDALAAWMEVLEYVRVAVQTIRVESCLKEEQENLTQPLLH